MARLRAPQNRLVESELPYEMACGPCIEIWAGSGPVTTGAASWRARRNWQRAVNEWAIRTGWAGEGRPASNAQGLARTHHPWSRDFLIARGEQGRVDYLEGRTPVSPPRVPWEPRHD